MPGTSRHFATACNPLILLVFLQFPVARNCEKLRDFLASGDRSDGWACDLRRKWLSAASAAISFARNGDVIDPGNLPEIDAGAMIEFFDGHIHEDPQTLELISQQILLQYGVLNP